MPRVKLNIGVGAIGGCLTSRLHPNEIIYNKYDVASLDRHHRTEGLIVQRMEMKNVNSRQQLCYVVTHADYIDNDNDTPIELHMVKCNFKITQEGDANQFFDETDEAAASLAAEDTTAPDTEHQELLPDEVVNFRPDDVYNDFSVLIRNGIGIDDDSNPAPENTIPIRSTVFTTFGWNGICQRRAQTVAHNYDPRMNNIPVEIQGTLSMIQLFELFFPKKFVLDVIIPETNNVLVNEMDYSDFIMFIAIWFAMATDVGSAREDFWSTKPIERLQGAPFRVHDLMDKSRFDNILQAMRYTNIVPNDDLDIDKFSAARQLIEAWNENMAKNFNAGWVCCLDNSMSPWTSKCACPGLYHIPRMPWILGNEYHSICCSLSGILFQVEIVEGKSARADVVPEFQDRGGPTVGVLLRITKPIHHQGCVLMLDSKYCVLKGISELVRRGVYATSVVQKKKFWPAHVDSEAIRRYFEDKPIGTVGCMEGILDGVRVNLMCMKEENYISTLMSSYGTLFDVPDHSITRDIPYPGGGGVTRQTFHYTEVFSNYIRYRNAVQEHNNNRRKPICLEEVWQTNSWPNRVFSFLLGVTEVNVKKGMEYFCKRRAVSMIEFRKTFSSALINYALEMKHGQDVTVTTGAPSGTVKRKLSDHTKVQMPRYHTWSKGRFVPCLTEYSQRKCTRCPTKTRNYCSCNPALALCINCIIEHAKE